MMKMGKEAKSRWTRLAITCLAAACIFHEMRGTSKSAEMVRRLSTDSFNDETHFDPVSIDPFAGLMVHPQENELPPSTRTGPGDDTVFLIGIFSTNLSTKEVEKRELIRETYLSYNNDPRICSLQDFVLLKDENSERGAICKVLYTFVIGGKNRGPTDHLRSEEPLVLNPVTRGSYETDVVYLNIKENMQGGKSPTWFKYAATVTGKYGIDYVAKADSDTMISMPHLMDYIITDLAPYPYNVRIYGGNHISNPTRAPEGSLYAAGQFYFLSSDMAAYVSSDELDRRAIVSASRGWKTPEPKTPFEDLDMGVFVWTHPMPVKFVMMSQKRFWLHPVKSVEQWMSLWEEYMGVPPTTRGVGWDKYMEGEAYSKHLLNPDDKDLDN